MSKLLKIAGVTSGKLASGIRIDEHGRIELSRTVEPKRIIGNVLEPYTEDYKGPVSVFGLELYAINSEYRTGHSLNSSQPTPDGWLMKVAGNLVRYDSKGAAIWVSEKRAGEGPNSREGNAALHGGHVYAVTRIETAGNATFAVDKLSYKTGKIVQKGGNIQGASIGAVDLSYAASIDRLIGIALTSSGIDIIYVHPETLEVEYSGDITGTLTSIFGSSISGSFGVRYERGVIYVLADTRGVASAKVDTNIALTVLGLTKLFDNSITTGSGFVLDGDVYSESWGPQRYITRNGVVIHTGETPKTADVFIGGTAGNLALMADGNKVLAFDKSDLVMSVEIPHDILISNIAGDSMGNIFVGTTGGIYILGDTLQIKGYQLVR